MKNSNLITVLISVALMLLLIWFTKDFTIRILGGFTDKETKIERDTIRLPVRIDTVEVFHAYIKTKGINLNPKPIVKYVVEYKDREPVIIDSTKNFTIQIRDSLIDGVFSVINSFDGDVLDSEFKYKPLFPKYIQKEIPIIVKEHTTTVLSNDKNRIGIGGGINSLFHPSVHLSVITKKDIGYSIEYSSPKLTNPNTTVPDNAGIKITKFF